MRTNAILPIGITALLCLTSCNATNSTNQTDNQVNAKPSNQAQTSSSPNSQSLVKTTVDSSKAEKFTDTAKYLAGIKLNNNSPLAQSQKSSIWLKQQQYFENNWSKLETQQLTKVTQWSKQELQQVNNLSPSVFYPFSGPDFLYAYSFFPKGKEYILMGLEPAGKVLDLTAASENDRARKLEEVRSSLFAILQLSFFRTNDMKVDLEKQGVLPILYVFLARTQNRILDVQNVGIDKQGKIQPFVKGMISGVKISFVPEGESQARNLYYFSADLSNDGLKKRPELNQFISGVNKEVTYLKAASYLMYNDSFAEIKKNIIQQSKYVLQDDSGMPMKAFDNSKWNLKFYGNYTNPISLFSGSYQANLRKIYSTQKDIKPLNFGIGYKMTASESNLMLAESKNISTSKNP
ncbi:hypothetical protein NIES4101_71640 [Calothrix sp. NIES-4101]|nr:hypothetical protein NIES4101_71640 [Calothrix sp. NIES-4101]